MTLRQALHSTVILAALLALSACAGLKPQAWVQDSLYFGLSRPSGVVSPAEWQSFVDQEITPRFPDGLTTWAAAGQWRGKADQVQREDSRVLQIMHPAGADADAKIQEIRDAYKKRFDQESVLRVQANVKADF